MATNKSADSKPGVMLTGDQIAAARRLAGLRSQSDLANAAGCSPQTIFRAENAGNHVPNINAMLMADIIRALEKAGVEFGLEPGRSPVGGISMRLKHKHR